jgi:hypothetical protein
MAKRKQTSNIPTKQYWDNAAKQFSWPIDHNDKYILVPEDELIYAEDDLMVQYFRKYGWHIQSCISVEHTKVFTKPTTPGPIFRGDLKPNVQVRGDQFHCNDKFLIKSTGTRLMICEVTKKSISLKYLDIEKDNIITTPENLARSLRMGVFEIIL